jgi:hypothetical protein
MRILGWCWWLVFIWGNFYLVILCSVLFRSEGRAWRGCRMLRGLALFCAGLSLSVGLLCGGCCGLPMGLTYC